MLLSKTKLNEPIGLTSNELSILRDVFSKYPEIEQVILFGSRAMNIHKQGSDVDLLLHGKEVDFSIVASVHGDLEGTTLPYFFDVIDKKTVSSEELLEHVKRFGVELYSH